MESKLVNILDLNDYCLVQIIKYLSIENQVQFAETCNRFREVFRDWFNVLHADLEIKHYYHIQPDDSVTLDASRLNLKLLDIVEDIVKRMNVKIYVINHKRRWHWQSSEFGESPIQVDTSIDICKKIERMHSLEALRLKQFTPKILFPTGITALEGLPRLMSIVVKSYGANGRIDVKWLERVSKYIIFTEKIAKICKSNEKLRFLLLKLNFCDLDDIVPYCPNLEDIAFSLNNYFNGLASLAELPKIRKVVIDGTKRIRRFPFGELADMFDAFTKKGKETELRSLILFMDLNFTMTSKLVQLVQLRELCCSLEDAKCMDLLTNLTELESLYIMLAEAGTKETLNVLRSCRKLQRLHMNSNVQIDFLNEVQAVLKTVRNPEKQKPLQLYITGILHLCEDDKKKLIDAAYCELVNKSEYITLDPWDDMLFEL